MSLTFKQVRAIITHASSALFTYCREHDLHRTVTGISGGVDSAVTLGLSEKASELAKKEGYELTSIGLILPCHSDPEHAILAKKVIKKFGAELLEIDLTRIFDIIEKGVLKPIADEMTEFTTAERYRVAQGNIKARLRMTLGTYFVANLVNGLVLSTDNYSEYWMGFWTLHGDVGDFGMIQELWKSDEVYPLARALGVPEEVIKALPTDGLGIKEGGDEAQMGAPYPVVDTILRTLLQKGINLNGSLDQLRKLPQVEGVSEQLTKAIAEKSLRSSFKRKSPVNLKRSDLGL